MLDSSKVMLGNKEEYEEFGLYRNITLDYDRILEFCPLYDEIRKQLKKRYFISMSKVQEEFERNYRDTYVYRVLKNNLSESDVLKLMSSSMNYNYLFNKLKFNQVKKEAIKLCDLIDYIGHYPATYPVPTDDEKNLKLEKMLEQYDIMVRYRLGDYNKMQILSDDVFRLIEALKEHLNILSYLDKLLYENNDWMFWNSFYNNKSFEVLDVLPGVDLSVKQEVGESEREEAKKYLRLNYGKDII